MTEFIDLSQTKPIEHLAVTNFDDETQGMIADFKSRAPDYDSLSDLDPAILALHAVG